MEYHEHIEDETNWIYSQLANGNVPLFRRQSDDMSREEEDLPISKADIIRFLELHHVQKLDVSVVGFALVTSDLDDLICTVINMCFILHLDPIYCHVSERRVLKLVERS